MHYVAGFLFVPDLNYVVLILKNKPDWQRGKLNAVGGKIETGEMSDAAMAREFAEETGVRFNGWKVFLNLMTGEDVIHFLTGVSDLAWHVGSPTDEPVCVVRVASVEHDQVALGHFMPDDGGGVRALVPSVYNLPWLVRMALDHLKNGNTYNTFEAKKP